MPSPIPLLLGAAALLFMGKKKRPSAPKISTYAPPALTKAEKKSGSGYGNISRDRMQWIQTSLLALGFDVGEHGTDGLYGPDTKAAVLAFQKAYMPESAGWDGKPGSKTQQALESALEARAQKQEAEAAPLDECDPIDPETWGAGHVCDFEGGRWVRKKVGAAPLASNALPPVAPKEVGFSADYSQIKIGSSFKYGVLDPWLNDRRKAGLIPTKDYGPSFAAFFIDDPASFIASIFGAKKATGDFVYGTLFTLSTAGIGIGLQAIRMAAVKMAGSLAMKANTFGSVGRPDGEGIWS